jgi:Flp pilus assembly protein TadG
MIQSWNTRIERLRGDQGGAVAVEFAIAGSLFIVMLIGTLQLGWALQVRNQMTKAADRAVRYVLLNPQADDATFKAEASKALRGYDPKRLVVTVGQATVGTTTYRTLNLSYNVPLYIPGASADLLTLKVSQWAPKF